MEPASSQKAEARVLLREVRRYLVAVEAFRTEGREPRWRCELCDEDEVDAPRCPRIVGVPPIP